MIKKHKKQNIQTSCLDVFLLKKVTFFQINFAKTLDIFIYLRFPVLTNEVSCGNLLIKQRGKLLYEYGKKFNHD